MKKTYLPVVSWQFWVKKTKTTQSITSDTRCQFTEGKKPAYKYMQGLFTERNGGNASSGICDSWTLLPDSFFSLSQLSLSHHLPSLANSLHDSSTEKLSPIQNITNSQATIFTSHFSPHPLSPHKWFIQLIKIKSIILLNSLHPPPSPQHKPNTTWKMTPETKHQAIYFNMNKLNLSLFTKIRIKQTISSSKTLLQINNSLHCYESFTENNLCQTWRFSIKLHQKPICDTNKSIHGWLKRLPLFDWCTGRNKSPHFVRKSAVYPPYCLA